MRKLKQKKKYYVKTRLTKRKLEILKKNVMQNELLRCAARLDLLAQIC
jgi:hypothetical protein